MNLSLSLFLSLSLSVSVFSTISKISQKERLGASSFSGQREFRRKDDIGLAGISFLVGGQKKVMKVDDPTCQSKKTMMTEMMTRGQLEGKMRATRKGGQPTSQWSSHPSSTLCFALYLRIIRGCIYLFDGTLYDRALSAHSHTHNQR